MKFSLLKYKQWLTDRQKIDHLSVDLLLQLNGMTELDGLDYEFLWKQNHIILKEWCVEDNIDSEIKIAYIKGNHDEEYSLQEFRSVYLRKKANELSKEV